MRAMAAPSLSDLPDNFHAGTTVTYSRAGGDYPANQGWSRDLYLAGASVLKVAGTASGADFLFTLDAASTAKLKAGTYQWKELATKAGEVRIADSGTVNVLFNIAAAGAGDAQSWEEATLAVVEDVLANRITADTQAYSIAGRAVTKIPVKELLELRVTLKRAVQAQKNPGVLGPQVLVRFTSEPPAVNSILSPTRAS